MNPEFWLDKWRNGQTQFHKETYHEKLLEFFPSLEPEKGQSILVPLCGKSRDLIWMASLGLKVVGVELSDLAVNDFFCENKISSFEVKQKGVYREYSYENIKILCGDFFKLSQIESFDFIYDRAALVALPFEMRKMYAQVIKRVIKKYGKYLLVSYQYDQSKMPGPPFSVLEAEIAQLFADQFEIKKLDCQESFQDNARLSAVEGLKQSVYLLQK